MESSHAESTQDNNNLTCSEAQQIRVSAMNSLARREHSRQELFQKLSQRFSNTATINAALDQLAQDNLQSDERFAESFVAYGKRKGQGPVRIAMELKRRGIDDDLIHVFLHQADHEWSQLIRDVCHKKFGCVFSLDNRKGYARQARFLQYRGFTLEQIGQLTKTACEDEWG